MIVNIMKKKKLRRASLTNIVGNILFNVRNKVKYSEKIETIMVGVMKVGDYIILAHYQVVMSMKLLKKGDW